MSQTTTAARRKAGAAEITMYRCAECQHTEHQWRGQCVECGVWGSMKEFQDTDAALPLTNRQAHRKRGWSIDDGGKPRRLKDVSADETRRLSTGIGELDRVLGETSGVAGMVPGAIVLLTGDPGCGKSSILLEASDRIARSLGPVLYASGEESVGQIKMRADRFGTLASDLYVAPETEIEAILAAVEDIRPAMLVIDSIQTMRMRQSSASSGSVSMVKECTETLLQVAKTSLIPIFLIGHVTKEGTMAGPQNLAHMVDAVLYMETDKASPYRILRGEKNRFGSTLEIGIFEMRDTGLIEVPNPSEALLQGRAASGAGSMVVPIIDGLRPMLVEIQALTDEAQQGTPRRSVHGADASRVNMVVATLSARIGINLRESDLYIKAIGGMKVTEPAADLPIAIAIASSLMKLTIDPKLIAFGEIGLSGEVRAVHGLERRLMEAARMNFKTALVPAPNGTVLPVIPGLKVEPVKTAKEAILRALGPNISFTEPS